MSQRLPNSSLAGASVIAGRDRYLLISVPPKAPRAVTSTILVVYGSADAATKASAQVANGAGWGGIFPALVAVADPDLDSGNFGVDIFGPVSRLPASVRVALGRVDGIRSGARGVCPLTLDDDVLEDLQRPLEGPVVKDPMDIVHPYLFRVDWKGAFAGVFNRNGMDWKTALRSIAEAGTIPGVGPDQLGELTASGIPAEYDGHELAVAKPDYPIIPEKVRNRFAALKEALGLDDDHELPDDPEEALQLVDSMGVAYDRRKADGSLPATPAQLDYANRIAETLGQSVRFPQNAPRREVEPFIEENRAEYRIKVSESRSPNAPKM